MMAPNPFLLAPHSKTQHNFHLNIHASSYLGCSIASLLSVIQASTFVPNVAIPLTLIKGLPTGHLSPTSGIPPHIINTLAISNHPFILYPLLLGQALERFS
jgi:hypothetical protein